MLQVLFQPKQSSKDRGDPQQKRRLGSRFFVKHTARRRALLQTAALSFFIC